MNALTQNERQALSRAVLEIDVNNHPGVMAHVIGLFSRGPPTGEVFSALPAGAARKGRIWLVPNEDSRLPQMMKQAEKLEDVIAIRRHGADHAVFGELEDFFRP